MTGEVTHYALDDGTVVAFETDPAPGYRPAGAGDVLSRVRDAVAPAVEAARVVAEQVRAAAPDEVKVCSVGRKPRLPR